MTWDENIENGKTALANADYQKAETEFSKALEHAKASFTHTDQRIPETISCLAQALYRQKRFDQSEPLLKQALKLHKALNTADIIKGIDTYTLACIQKFNGDTALSERNAKEGMRLLARDLQQVEVKNLIDSLASFIEPNGSSAPAELPSQQEGKAEEKAEASKKASSEAKDENIPASRKPEPTEQQYEDWTGKFNAGLELVNRKEAAQIVAGYKQLHELLVHIYKTFPLPHPCAAETINGMALAASYLELFDRAKNLYHLAIHDMEATLGPESFDTARIKLNLACLYKDQDDSSTGTYNADLYFRQSFDIFQKDPNMDQEWFNSTAHAFTQMLEKARVEMEGYAELQKISDLEQQHKLEEAYKAGQELYNKLKKYFPQSSNCYVTLFKEQARILRKLGKTTEADMLIHGAEDIEKNRLEKAALKSILDSQLPPVPTPWNV